MLREESQPDASSACRVALKFSQFEGHRLDLNHGAARCHRSSTARLRGLAVSVGQAGQQRKSVYVTKLLGGQPSERKSFHSVETFQQLTILQGQCRGAQRPQKVQRLCSISALIETTSPCLVVKPYKPQRPSGIEYPDRNNTRAMAACTGITMCRIQWFEYLNEPGLDALFAFSVQRLHPLP